MQILSEEGEGAGERGREGRRGAARQRGSKGGKELLERPLELSACAMAGTGGSREGRTRSPEPSRA
eukprot:1283208-Rhodomonas_salina.2